MALSKSLDPIANSRSVKPERSLIDLFTRFLGVAFFISVCAGCSLVGPVDQDKVIESRLNGRGPVYVSSDNQYIAANRFLASESERSVELSGFIKLRGMPERLEYDRAVLSDPRLVLYYDRSKESYQATRIDGVWVFEASAPKPNMSSEAGVKTSVPTPAAESPPQRSSTGFRSELSAQRAVTRSSDSAATCRELGGLLPAERSPSGDLIHYVIDELETALLIAEWYTGESAPAQTILRLNQIPPKAPLSVGDQLVIPKYLVKNSNQLGSVALRCMLTEKAINLPRTATP